MGATKRPSYRIIAAEAWGPRDGDFLETLGHYNPLTEPATVVLNVERLNDWISKGAQPTESVARILKRQGIALPEKALAVISTNRQAARGVAAAQAAPAPAAGRRAAAAPAAAVATPAASAPAAAPVAAPTAEEPTASAPEPEEAPVAEEAEAVTASTEESPAPENKAETKP